MTLGESLRLQSQQANLPAVFQDLAVQFSQALIDPSEVGATLREKVAIEGESLEQLLKEWINLLLDLVRTQRLLFTQIRVISVQTPENGPYTLQAEALGEHWDIQRHFLRLDPAWYTCKTASLRKEKELYLAETVITK